MRLIFFLRESDAWPHRPLLFYLFRFRDEAVYDGRQNALSILLFLPCFLRRADVSSSRRRGCFIFGASFCTRRGAIDALLAGSSDVSIHSHPLSRGSRFISSHLMVEMNECVIASSSASAFSFWDCPVSKRGIGRCIDSLHCVADTSLQPLIIGTHSISSYCDRMHHRRRAAPGRKQA